MNASLTLLIYIRFPISERIPRQCSCSSRHHGGTDEGLRSGTQCHLCNQLFPSALKGRHWDSPEPSDIQGHPVALLAGAAQAQLVLGDRKGAEQPAPVADIGVNDTCAINHRAPVSQMEKQQWAALPGAAHLA